MIVLVSLAGVVGGLFVCLRQAWSDEALHLMISVGGGLLLALTILDLLPHAIEHGGHSLMPFVLIGFVLLFMVERIGQRRGKLDTNSMTGVVIGFLLHAFFEGFSLAASLHADEKLGVPLLGALILHRIPDGVTVASLLLAATSRRLFAFLGAVALGVVTFLGAYSMEVAGLWLSHDVAHMGMALSAGVFLYVSASHIVPFIQRGIYPRMSLFFTGALLMYMVISLFLHIPQQ